MSEIEQIEFLRNLLVALNVDFQATKALKDWGAAYGIPVGYARNSYAERRRKAIAAALKRTEPEWQK